MDEVIDRLWAEIEDIVFITRDQFERGLREWDIIPVEIDGASFVTLRRGPEFHVANAGTGRPITTRMIRMCIAPILEQYGFVTTRTPKDDERQCVVNRRFGFKAIGEDEFFTHFRMQGEAKQ